MNFETLLFYFFSLVLIGGALAVVSVRNPVHAALCLVLSFFTCAGLWILLESEFLALTLVLVYVGAVMVLFVFVVMMLDNNLTPLREGVMRYAPFGVIVSLVIIAELMVVLGPDHFGLAAMPAPDALPADYSNTRALGRVLYTVYVYPFEIASVVLLVAIIAAITLTLRKRSDSKHQDPGRQVQVRSEDRVRIVSMKAERPVSHSNEEASL